MLILDSQDIQNDSQAVLVVVQEELLESLNPDLEQYTADLERNNIRWEILSWQGSSAELRSELQNYTEGGWAAFFIGDIPPRYYEQTVFNEYETFPTDLYYSCPNAIWQDQDGNGVLDNHSMLTVEIPVSRIMGSEDEIRGYLNRVHQYRTGQLSFPSRALLFKDDDWSNYLPGDDFGLGAFTQTVEFRDNLDESLQWVYLQEIQANYLYVYQWIHSIPGSLFIQEGSSYRIVNAKSLPDYSIENGFYNLFDCSAARFTEDNIAMNLVMNSTSGLAALGSTKVGGNFEPLEFHRNISMGNSWGRSYMNWYNRTGSFDDAWYLGMIIIGDPLLKLQFNDQHDSNGPMDMTSLIPPNSETRQTMLRALQDAYAWKIQ